MELITVEVKHCLNVKGNCPECITKMAAPDSGLNEEEFIASSDAVLLCGSKTTATL